MFTAVVMEESGRRGWWGTVADWFWPAMPREEARALPGEGEGFRLIRCPCVPSQKHWARLVSQAGQDREKLVLDPGVPIPSGSGLRRFWPEKFFLRVAANTAIRSVKTAGVELSRRRIGLVDRDGQYQWLARLLLEEFAEVRVVCPQPKVYEVFSKEMMEQKGAAVPVIQEDGLDGCLLVLDPEKRSPRRWGNGEMLWLAPFQTGEQVVNTLRCTAPPGYGGIIPIGLETTYFLGAACQQGGREELWNCTAARCRIGGRDTSAEELAVHLRRRDRLL